MGLPDLAAFHNFLTRSMIAFRRLRPLLKLSLASFYSLWLLRLKISLLHHNIRSQSPLLHRSMIHPRHHHLHYHYNLVAASVITIHLEAIFTNYLHHEFPYRLLLLSKLLHHRYYFSWHCSFDFLLTSFIAQVATIQRFLTMEVLSWLLL